MNILIVDDSVALRKILQRVIRNAGIEIGQIQEAGDGRAALECLETFKPDLVLSDINMPGMSGLELLRQIKEKHNEPPPVVMMITAYGDAENYNTAMKLGADDFLTKPLEFNLLKEKLKAIH